MKESHSNLPFRKLGFLLLDTLKMVQRPWPFASINGSNRQNLMRNTKEKGLMQKRIYCLVTTLSLFVTICHLLVTSKSESQIPGAVVK